MIKSDSAGKHAKPKTAAELVESGHLSKPIYFQQIGRVKRPGRLYRIWKFLKHKEPGDIESPLEAIAAGVALLLCIPAVWLLLALISAISGVQA